MLTFLNRTVRTEKKEKKNEMKNMRQKMSYIRLRAKRQNDTLYFISKG